MLLQAVNECEVTLMLKAVSPLLVKDGRYSQEERDAWARNPEAKTAMPNMVPISRASLGELRAALSSGDPLGQVQKLSFFLPGSSLRGAWRSHLERVLRGLDSPDKMRVCDPFEEDLPQDSCSSYATRFRDTVEDLPANKEKPPVIPYRLSCPVCKLFGNTLQGGRLKLTDGERIRPSEGTVIAREHVRIDRASGQVARGVLFKIFALQSASFRVALNLRNFELWHLQLLGALFGELKRGMVPLGSGKNKGYGRVECVVDQVRLTAFGLDKPADALHGVAEHSVSGQWFEGRYGVKAVEAAPPLPAGSWIQINPWRWQREVKPNEFEKTVQQLKLPWGRFPALNARPVPEAQ